MKTYFQRTGGLPAAVAAVLGGILAGATHYLTPQQHDYGSVWGMCEQEQTDSIDVLFFGSSVTYCDVVPAYWENSGLTAFCAGRPEQPLPLTLIILRESPYAQVTCYGIPWSAPVAFHQYMGFTKTNIGQMPGSIVCTRPFLMPNPRSARDCFRCTSITTAGRPSYEGTCSRTEDMLAGYTFLSGGTDKGPDDCETVDTLPRRDWNATWMPLRIFTRSAAGTIFSWCCTVLRQSVCTPTGTG